MTDPKDFFPWAPKPDFSHKKLKVLLESRSGRIDLKRELTAAIKQFLEVNPQFIGTEATHQDYEDQGDENAKTIMKIYDLLRQDGVRQEPGGNLRIYYKAYRAAARQFGAWVADPPFPEDYSND